jgi:hypothetical protein
MKKLVTAKKRLATKYKILEAKGQSAGGHLYQGGSPGKNKKHAEAHGSYNQGGSGNQSNSKVVQELEAQQQLNQFLCEKLQSMDIDVQELI